LLSVQRKLKPSLIGKTNRYGTSPRLRRRGREKDRNEKKANHGSLKEKKKGRMGGKWRILKRTVKKLKTKKKATEPLTGKNGKEPTAFKQVGEKQGKKKQKNFQKSTNRLARGKLLETMEAREWYPAHTSHVGADKKTKRWRRNVSRLQSENFRKNIFTYANEEG